MHITCVVGARPNFMKIAPILDAAKRVAGIQTLLVHTGQHYDERMSELFFTELSLPRPDVYLNIKSGNHAVQTAKVMIAFDEWLEQNATDMVLVVGDVTSTLACSLVACKRNVAIAHVEAGLRSRDRRMPEEINRILTDQISDYLFTTERLANENLKLEGIPEARIHFVGNLMIDTLLRHRERALLSDILSRLGLSPKKYAVCTMHRPSNVDEPDAANNTLQALTALAERLPVLLPLHPRTRNRWTEFGLMSKVAQLKSVIVTEPLGYFDFLAAMAKAKVVFTDSGGIQEETTVLGVPCLTFRENTERPITITEGTNQLVGISPNRLADALDEILAGKSPRGRIPELWDGKAGDRIINLLAQQPLNGIGREHSP